MVNNLLIIFTKTYKPSTMSLEREQMIATTTIKTNIKINIAKITKITNLITTMQILQL